MALLGRAIVVLTSVNEIVGSVTVLMLLPGVRSGVVLVTWATLVTLAPTALVTSTVRVTVAVVLGASVR